MQDRIIVDFNALNGIAARLQTAGRELDAAARSLGRLSLTRDAGMDQRLDNASLSLRTIGTTISAGTVGAAIMGCKSALNQVGDCGDRLSAAVRNIASLFETAESSLIDREPQAGDNAPGQTGGGSSGGGGGGGGGGAWGVDPANGSAGVAGRPRFHAEGEGSFFGNSVSGSSGGWLGGLLGAEGAASWDVLGGSFDVSSMDASVEGHLGRGKVSGSLFGGLVSGSAMLAAGSLSASGSVGATLYDEGKFRPHIGAEVSGEATALKGEIGTSLGSDANNVHGKAEGKLFTAETSAGVQAGVYKTKDADGNEITVAGVKAEAGAEAYIASGKVSGGFSIFGVKVDASLKGHVGTGAKAGGEISSSYASLDFGAALGLGAGISINVDWSDFKFGWW